MLPKTNIEVEKRRMLKQQMSNREAEGERVRALFRERYLQPGRPQSLLNQMLGAVNHFQANLAVSGEWGADDLGGQFGCSAIPENSVAVERYMDLLSNFVLPNSINMASPRCLGHMTSVLPSFTVLINHFLTSLNQNLVKRSASRSMSIIERQAIAMVHQLIYDNHDTFYEEHIHDQHSTLGLMAGGGTLANMTALWVARNAILGPLSGFAGVEEEGLSAALGHRAERRVVVLGSELMHYSFEKAVGSSGLGSQNLLRIPVDRKNRMVVRALEDAVLKAQESNERVLMIVGIAGTTDCGSIDPLNDIAAVAQEAGAYFHVDAAWGAPLRFSRKHRGRLAGIEKADSVTLDGHKQMYLPLGTSMLMFRDPLVPQVIEKQSRYILQADSGDLGMRSLEGSRECSALYVHAALHVIGSSGYEYLVEENIRRARLMAELVRMRTDFELLFEPETNIVLYRYIPKASRMFGASRAHTGHDAAAIDSANVAIQEAQYREGRSYVSRTTLTSQTSGPVVALRAVIANPFTTEEDMSAVLDDQARIASKLGF
jgi:putative pyridoxal-dependent aspartate 1-decarboxylase